MLFHEGALTNFGAQMIVGELQIFSLYLNVLRHTFIWTYHNIEVMMLQRMLTRPTTSIRILSKGIYSLISSQMLSLRSTGIRTLVATIHHALSLQCQL